MWLPRGLDPSPLIPVRTWKRQTVSLVKKKQRPATVPRARNSVSSAPKSKLSLSLSQRKKTQRREEALTTTRRRFVPPAHMASSLLQHSSTASSSSSSSLFTPTSHASNLRTLGFIHLSRTRRIFTPNSVVIIIMILLSLQFFSSLHLYFILMVLSAISHLLFVCARNVICQNLQIWWTGNRSFRFLMKGRFPSSWNLQEWRKPSTETVTGWNCSLAPPILHFPR